MASSRSIGCMRTRAHDETVSNSRFARRALVSMAACIVSSVAWLPRGALKPRPEAEEPSEEEVAALRARDAAAAAGTLDDHVEEEEEEEEMEESDEEEEAEDTPRSARRNAAAAAAAASAQPASVAFRVDARVEEALAGLHMETYDDEEEGEDVAAARLFGGSGPHTVFASNAEDPYITLQEDEDEEEASDFVLRDTGASQRRQTCACARPAPPAAPPWSHPSPVPDLVILAARTEDEVSHLELCVYEEATEEAEANLFVHHDLLLPGTPPAFLFYLSRI
jgi:periodic tryptophan protein 1